MKYHLCVPIKIATEKLQKGQNLFNASPNVILRYLTLAQSEGKEYYSGCENMDEKGRCAGHQANSKSPK